MSKISAVIITFNEEVYIEQCIKSVSEVADEIVVVDSYSTDRTKEICLSLGVRFIEHCFLGYRDQKNYALAQATYDYILSLDADEALSPRLERSILSVKQDLKYDGYKFNRLNNYCGKWIHYTNLSPERKIRLFNRKNAQWGGLNIHETVMLKKPKNVIFLEGDLLHWLYDSYEESIEKMNKYTTILANEYFKQGVKPTGKRILINPLWRFIHSYFLKGGFLDGRDGYMVSKLLSITCFMKYVKLKKIYKDAALAKLSKEYSIDIYKEDKPGKIAENPRPFLIGFDAKRAFFNHSGLGNYSRNLLTALSNRHPMNSYLLFTPKTKDRLIVENEGQFKLIEPKHSAFRILNSLWRVKYMIGEIKRQKVNIFHGLSQELPVGIEKTGVKSVVTVHDLIFMRYPEFYNFFDSKIYRWKLIHACKVADHIVAISKQTKNDLVKFLNLPPAKISVIYQGCNSHFWERYTQEFISNVKLKYNLPERYLLYVGTIEERKNLLNIVKAIDLLNIKIPLVVIGRRAGPYYDEVVKYILTHDIKNVIFPDHILNSELPCIYQAAECFLYPSLFEGFGIPILEALVSGTPVITSKRGCFAEAAGPGSIFIDPHDPEMIGEAILKVINDKDLKEKMISTGKEFAKNFREDVIAENYMKLYNALLADSNH